MQVSNTDVQDLISQLCAVIPWAWQRHAHDGNSAACARACVSACVLGQKLPCQWLSDLQAVSAEYEEYSTRANHGMRNDWYSAHKVFGQFYAFDLQHAHNVVRLLVENSCVRSGDNYFHQTSGIPMGISPALIMANYYLFYYEYCFVQRIVLLIQDTPPLLQPGHCVFVEDVLHCTTEEELSRPQHASYVGDAALHLLTEVQIFSAVY